MLIRGQFSKLYPHPILRNDNSFFISLDLCEKSELFITTAQLHSTKPELRLCAGLNPARVGVLKVCDGENLFDQSL